MLDDNHPDYWQIAYERNRLKEGDTSCDVAPSTKFKPYPFPKLERKELLGVIA